MRLCRGISLVTLPVGLRVAAPAPAISISSDLTGARRGGELLGRSQLYVRRAFAR